MADSGTIFLDEIGDISQRIQLHLLRVLQEMEFERVGDSTPVRVDVRVIAATNQDLSAKIRSGEFREDLYYRLKVVEITLPPLRDRMEDIPLFVDYFINKFNKKLNREVSGVSLGVSKIFMDYPWPGNVRELEHTLEHAVILCRQNIVTVDHLPAQFRDLKKAEKIAGGDRGIDEQKEILKALEKTAGNKARAARLLGMDRKTLYRKIERYNITTQGS
jgi:transcriptional regulator with PAS, ATPase and Fis domain